MGAPNRYGTEIALRCNALLGALYDGEQGANKVTAKNGMGLGPTFLLAMAHPMFVIPYERFMKGAGHRFKLSTHEETLAKLLKDTEKGHQAGSSLRPPPSFNGRCDFASFPVAAKQHSPKFPFGKYGGYLDEDLIEKLETEPQDLPKTDSCISIIRHCLSHGNVIYLNGDGEVAHGEAVEAFLFANEKGTVKKIEAYEFIRISIADFRKYLHEWALWLEALEEEAMRLDATANND